MRAVDERLRILKGGPGWDAPPVYAERELGAPVDLCDARGRLNPDAVGFSRFPRVRANLHGHWPRKKRWNFWSWISPRFCLSAVIADIDYAAFCSYFFVDFESGERVEGMDPGWPGREMPEHVERSIAWRGRRAELEVENHGGDLQVRLRGRTRAGDLRADFAVRKPPEHESLNVVVPWTPTRFQLNSKHNTLRCEGRVEVAGRRYALRPEDCHAVQDWGRGVWPRRSCWNWGVATGEVDGRLLGVNVGSRWTTGTGSNENGILVDGRLHKVGEDLAWEYTRGAWDRPWRVRTPASDRIDLVLEPFHTHVQDLDLGLLASGGGVAFGRWRGVVRCDAGEFELPGLVGWAEEFAHRW